MGNIKTQGQKIINQRLITKGIVYEDFNDGKINLLNTYKQTVEMKLEKSLTLNEKNSNIIEEDEDYQSESDIAMEAEMKIRESLENLRTILSTKSKSTTHNLHRTSETGQQFNQVKLRKFVIKPFS